MKRNVFWFAVAMCVVGASLPKQEVADSLHAIAGTLRCLLVVACYYVWRSGQSESTAV